MQLREGVHVYTWDDKDVGHIDRVVLNPDTNEVTHVVVRQGFLFTEDKVVPIDYLASADEDRAMLRQDIEDLDNLPRFEEQHYVPAYYSEETYPDYPPETAGPLFWYPPTGTAPYYGPGYYGPGLYGAARDIPRRWPYRSGDHYVAQTEQNIPEDTVAVRDGANVISADGKHVGDVERVFVDSEDYATHIVISQGLLFKERKMVPTTWLRIVLEGEIHLSVHSDYIDSLPAYEDEPEASQR